MMSLAGGFERLPLEKCERLEEEMTEYLGDRFPDENKVASYIDQMKCINDSSTIVKGAKHDPFAKIIMVLFEYCSDIELY